MVTKIVEKLNKLYLEYASKNKNGVKILINPSENIDFSNRKENKIRPIFIICEKIRWFKKPY